MSTRGAEYLDPASRLAADHVVPALEMLLGTAMGMAVEAVTVDGTLADLLPELDADRAARQYAEAKDRAVARARELARA